MKESDFINQNINKWKEVEENLSNKDVSPSETSKLFVQVIDDLSYANTFYKNRSVKIYLNEIAKFLFNDVNKTKSSYLKLFMHFWKVDLPLVMYLSRKSMLISLTVFVCCFILGVITSIYDPDFCKTILSSGYIDMTNENIAKGDPMAVYKSRGELELFFPIFLNNISIVFYTFFSGIFMAIGSLFVMIVNGVMVGVFQYFFIEKGLFWESFLAIWTHGTLEISAIIISGGAGLTLGKGLLFPGTLSRFQALKISGMQGLKIILGVTPVVLLAAFIEGFLTRHTNIPDAIRFSFILLSFLFILIYFFWYPNKVANNTANIEDLLAVNPIYKNSKPFNPHEILGAGAIISETLRLFFKEFKVFGGHILGLSVLITAITAIGVFLGSATGFSIFDFFNYESTPWLLIIHLLCFSFIQVKGFLFLKNHLSTGSNADSKQPALITIVLFSAIFIGFMAIISDDFKFLAFVLLPLFSLVTSIIIHQNVSFTQGINTVGGLMHKQWGTFLKGLFFSGTLSILFYVAFYFIINFLSVEKSLIWVLTSDPTIAEKIVICVKIFSIFFSVLLYISLNTLFHSVFYNTLKEINTAQHLISRIHLIKAAK